MKSLPKFLYSIFQCFWQKNGYANLPFKRLLVAGSYHTRDWYLRLIGWGHTICINILHNTAITSWKWMLCFAIRFDIIVSLIHWSCTLQTILSNLSLYFQSISYNTNYMIVFLIRFYEFYSHYNHFEHR